jgi:hypothetical protein
MRSCQVDTACIFDRDLVCLVRKLCKSAWNLCEHCGLLDAHIRERLPLHLSHSLLGLLCAFGMDGPLMLASVTNGAAATLPRIQVIPSPTLPDLG